MSYNVNAIVGKYIMPVTIRIVYNENDKCRKIRVYKDAVVNDNKFKQMMSKRDRPFYEALFPVLCPFDEGIASIEHKAIMNGRYQFPNFMYKQHCVVPARSIMKVPYCLALFKELKKRYKPTSKYYMAFARISEYFY